MRSALALLGVLGTTSAHRHCDSDVAVDESTLLQSRSVVRKNTASADLLLQNLKDMAKSLQQDSFAKTDPAGVTSALGSANEALALMFPGFVQEHAAAQHEIAIQMGEVNACHSSAAHGLAARAQNEERVANRHAASQQCEEVMATALETQVTQCGQWEDLVNQVSTPGCAPSTSEELYEVARSWRAWVNENMEQIESQRSECNAANAAVETQSQLCATLADAFTEAFCRTSQACVHHNSCFAHEVDIFNSLKAEVEAAALVRQQQYITAMQAQCLVELIMGSLRSGTPISDDALTSCDDVNADDLTLSFPELPEEPADCPAMQESDPPCAPVPHVLGWTAGRADDSLDLQPNEGSPPDCRCELLDVQGYSAGHVVRCENCLDVSKSTDVNSCPSGMKIFSPQDRADWDLLAPHLVGAPNRIVDVTRPENGCGGCQSAAMNSDTPAQSSWVTADGSPWWLSDQPFGEPNGDYFANCYLVIGAVHDSHIHFNDARHGACHYHSTSYLCQPVRHHEEPSCTCEARNHLHHLDSEYQTITSMYEWVAARGGMSSLTVTKTGGEGNCVVRVATGAGGAGALAHVYEEGAHPFPLPTGNDNVGSIMLQCVAGAD